MKNTTAYYFGVFAQRFSAEGVRLWDPEGVPFVTEEGIHLFENAFAYATSASDCADGMWAVVDRGFSMEKYIAHLKSDGEVNINYRHPLLIGSGANILDDSGVALCTDDKGGVFVGYIKDDTKQLWFGHYSQEWYEAGGTALWDPGWDYNLIATPDGFGGAYFYASRAGNDGHGYIQRINANDEPILDPTQRLLIGGADNICHAPAVLADGSAVFCFGDDSTYNIARLDTNLNYLVHPDTAVFLGDFEWLTNVQPAIKASFDGERAIAMVLRSSLEFGVAAITMHLFPPEGKPDLWATPSRILETRSDGTSNNLRLLHLSDGYYLATTQYEPGITKLFRIAPDGPPVSVEDEPGTALPVKYGIDSAWPNPFNGSVSLDLRLPENQPAELLIFNIEGRQVARINLPNSADGFMTYTWKPDPTLSSGTYLVSVRVQGHEYAARKLVLVE